MRAWPVQEFAARAISAPKSRPAASEWIKLPRFGNLTDATAQKTLNTVERIVLDAQPAHYEPGQTG